MILVFVKFTVEDKIFEGPSFFAVNLTNQVVPRGKFDSTNQKHYSDLGSDASSVWNFCARFLRRHLAGKPVVASPNVGCFLRLAEDETKNIVIFIHHSHHR